MEKRDKRVLPVGLYYCSTWHYDTYIDVHVWQLISEQINILPQLHQLIDNIKYCQKRSVADPEVYKWGGGGGGGG